MVHGRVGARAALVRSDCGAGMRLQRAPIRRRRRCRRWRLADLVRSLPEPAPASVVPNRPRPVRPRPRHCRSFRRLRCCGALRRDHLRDRLEHQVADVVARQREGDVGLDEAFLRAAVEHASVERMRDRSPGLAKDATMASVSWISLPAPRCLRAEELEDLRLQDVAAVDVVVRGRRRPAPAFRPSRSRRSRCRRRRPCRRCRICWSRPGRTARRR